MWMWGKRYCLSLILWPLEHHLIVQSFVCEFLTKLTKVTTDVMECGGLTCLCFCCDFDTLPASVIKATQSTRSVLSFLVFSLVFNYLFCILTSWKFNTIQFKELQTNMHIMASLRFYCCKMLFIQMCKAQQLYCTVKKGFALSRFSFLPISHT